jgi:hypothetical protein
MITQGFSLGFVAVANQGANTLSIMLGRGKGFVSIIPRLS